MKESLQRSTQETVRRLDRCDRLTNSRTASPSSRRTDEGGEEGGGGGGGAAYGGGFGGGGKLDKSKDAVRERLRLLKELHLEGLLSDDVYARQQQRQLQAAGLDADS